MLLMAMPVAIVVISALLLIRRKTKLQEVIVRR